MATADPEQQRARLAEHYSRQIDGQLEQVAAQAYELSEMARETLREELARRGLSPTLAKRPAVLPKRDLKTGKEPEAMAPVASVLPPKDAEKIAIVGIITLRQFRDLPEALLAKGSLESAGIRCVLSDDNMVRMDWFYSNAIGGIKLLVDSEDAAEAEQVLSQPIPEHFEVPDVGEYEQTPLPALRLLGHHLPGTRSGNLLQSGNQLAGDGCAHPDPSPGMALSSLQRGMGRCGMGTGRRSRPLRPNSLVAGILFESLPECLPRD